MPVTRTLGPALVRHVLLARQLEDDLQRLSRNGDIGPVALPDHARIAMVAAAIALEPGDMVFGTRRDFPAALARGTTPDVFFCQALGRKGDLALGRGLPGAINDAEAGVALSDGSPATHLVHATGFGHAARVAGEDRVALALFGSSAQANGELHAALNFAQVNTARVIFVARGPLAGELPMTTAAEAWGIRAVSVSAHEGIKIANAVVKARAAAIAGEGPTIIEARYTDAQDWADITALQEADLWSTDQARLVNQEIEETCVRALRAARESEGVSVDTLFGQVYSRAPWFLA